MKRKLAILLACVLTVQGIVPAAAEETAADAEAVGAVAMELAEKTAAETEDAAKELLAGKLVDEAGQDVPAYEELDAETVQNEIAAPETDAAVMTEAVTDAATGAEAETAVKPVNESDAEQTGEQEQEMETSTDGAGELIIEPDYADVELAETALPETSVIAAGDVPIDAAHFPDERFREYVEEFDTDGDGKFSQAEADAVEFMNVGGWELEDLKGVEYFYKLQRLYCCNSQLTSLDVSRCTGLTELVCYRNQLTSLDVSGCTGLTELSCEANQLTSLDVSGCTGLTELNCYENQLTSLDVSGCTGLTELNCYENQLPSLDVSGCTGLTELNCYENQLPSLDVSGCTGLTNLSCPGNQLTSLDINECTGLTELHCEDNQLTSLNVSGCTGLTELNCNGNQLTSLDVSGCTGLTDLGCGDNQLTSLDVSGRTGLTEMYCGGNQLTSLDVSGCTALTFLSCDNNQLPSLDVSGCTGLTELHCEDNQLTSLDVSGCTALTILTCDNNQLPNLDVSGCTGLTDLSCRKNQLTSLNLSMFGGLYVLMYSQKLEVQLKDAGENLVLDMAELVGEGNLTKISWISYGLDIENGEIIFPKDEWPGTVEYYYDTGCEDAGYMDVTLYLEYPNLDHEHNYVRVSVEATCTGEGYSYEECSVCHQEKEGSRETIPALGHTGGTATCAEKAVCTRCGQPYGELGTEHIYGKYVVTKQATALEEGIQTRTCMVCGKKKNRAVAKLAPTMKLNATSIKLKVKQSTTKIKVTGLALGDAVASWKSSNSKIVKVSRKGNGWKITAGSKEGTAKITVKLKSGLSKKISVTVQKGAVACTSVALDKQSLTLKKGKTSTLKATVKPLTCVQKVTYKSSNKSVATVNSKGKITAKKKGTATITVTVGKKTATCKVKVVK